MAIKEGFACFACDRPDKAHKDGKAPEVCLREGERARVEWIDTAYTDEHGVEQRLTLCPESAPRRTWSCGRSRPPICPGSRGGGRPCPTS